MCIEPPLPPHSPVFLANSSCIMPTVAALGDAVAVPAMGAGDVILRPQMRAHADRSGLLAGIEMDKTGDAALRELFLHPFLEAADRRHVAIGPINSSRLSCTASSWRRRHRSIAPAYRIAPPNPRERCIGA